MPEDKNANVFISNDVETQASITATIASEVPKPILYTGLAGTLPYVGTTLSTLYYARSAGLFPEEAAVALMSASTHIQVTYGAIILSFLGALHWGMEFAAYGGHRGYKRLALGVAPLLASLYPRRFLYHLHPDWHQLLHADYSRLSTP